ncbi:unnamed protein product [Arctogadus glacialis]
MLWGGGGVCHRCARPSPLLLHAHTHPSLNHQALRALSLLHGGLLLQPSPSDRRTANAPPPPERSDIAVKGQRTLPYKGPLIPV